MTLYYLNLLLLENQLIMCIAVAVEIIILSILTILQSFNNNNKKYKLLFFDLTVLKFYLFMIYIF